jgi:hypothetical protein
MQPSIGFWASGTQSMQDLASIELRGIQKKQQRQEADPPELHLFVGNIVHIIFVLPVAF